MLSYDATHRSLIIHHVRTNQLRVNVRPPNSRLRHVLLIRLQTVKLSVCLFLTPTPEAAYTESINKPAEDVLEE